MNLLQSYLNDKMEYQGISPKTLKAYSIDLNKTLPLVLEKEIDDITLDDIKSISPRMVNDVFKEMEKTGEIKVTTINRRLASFKDFHSFYASRYGFESVLKVLKPRHDTRTKKHDAYKYEERKQLINSTTNIRDKFCVTLLFGCGLRSQELLDLTKESIVGDELVVIGKRNKMRSIPMSPFVKSVAEDYLNSLPSDHQGNLVSLSYNGLRKMFTKYNTNLGLEGSHLHKCRHTFATTLVIENGVDLETASELLGHTSSITTSRFYLHSDKKQVAVNTLDMGM